MKFLENIGIKLYQLYCAVGLLLLSQICMAQTIIIHPNTVISFPKTYDNVTLDMSNGSFVIKHNATLTIKNCVINGKLSESNPVLMTVDNGNLKLSNNQVTITTNGLSQHPATQSLQYVMQFTLGTLDMYKNNFVIDQPYTAGLLITTASIPSAGYTITHNTFSKFHGVLYLIASDNNVIKDNVFLNNTYGHIVSIGNNNQIIHNTIYFSGNNHLGNAIDIIDSGNTVVSNNILLTPTCHGIYVINSHDLTLDSNRIYGGITHAMTILTYPETSMSLAGGKSKVPDYLAPILAQHKMTTSMSQNITITNNYMSQNRYGVAVMDINGLTIKNNTFVQRFEDAASRKFWTNNAILLQNVTGLTWDNNIYKEAYSQSMQGDNSHSSTLVVFPQTGGIIF